MNEEKTGPSPREIAIIAGAIVAVVIAAVVIFNTINANRIHDVIVIHGAKGAKPFGKDRDLPENGGKGVPGGASGIVPGDGGASDRPFPNNK